MTRAFLPTSSTTTTTRLDNGVLQQTFCRTACHATLVQNKRELDISPTYIPPCVIVVFAMRLKKEESSAFSIWSAFSSIGKTIPHDNAQNDEWFLYIDVMQHEKKTVISLRIRIIIDFPGTVRADHRRAPTIRGSHRRVENGRQSSPKCQWLGRPSCHRNAIRNVPSPTASALARAACHHATKVNCVADLAAERIFVLKNVAVFQNGPTIGGGPSPVQPIRALPHPKILAQKLQVPRIWTAKRLAKRSIRQRGFLQSCCAAINSRWLLDIFSLHTV